MISRIIQKHWYTQKTSWFFLIFMPLEMLYILIVMIRKFWYTSVLAQSSFPVPVIVVGNLTVGGTGKTPLVVSLIKKMQRENIKVGVVSKGYKRISGELLQVSAQMNSLQVGDEPLLIYNSTKVPVVVGKNRKTAINYLLKNNQVDIVVCDDGLQDFTIKYDAAIAVIDSRRKFGNGNCLPIGPLREPASNLSRVDFVVGNYRFNQAEDNCFANKMLYTLTKVINLQTKEIKDIGFFSNTKVHAVAGIGDPQSFFKLLQGYEVNTLEHPFADHYFFKAEDLNFKDDLPILVTEKDAIKIKELTLNHNIWYVEIKAEVSEQFFSELLKKIENAKLKQGVIYAR